MTVTKAHIIKKIADEFKCPIQEASAYVDDILDEIHEALRRDKSLMISGFGRFEVFDKTEKDKRNQKAPESAKDKSYTTVKFHTSRLLRELLNPDEAKPRPQKRIRKSKKKTETIFEGKYDSDDVRTSVTGHASSAKTTGMTHSEVTKEHLIPALADKTPKATSTENKHAPVGTPKKGSTNVFGKDQNAEPKKASDKAPDVASKHALPDARNKTKGNASQAAATHSKTEKTKDIANARLKSDETKKSGKSLGSGKGRDPEAKIDAKARNHALTEEDDLTDDTYGIGLDREIGPFSDDYDDDDDYDDVDEDEYAEDDD
jgi:integration host factor subunit alpha